MDSIVKKLSEIETAAVSIVEHAESQKEVTEQEMEQKRKEFDEALSTDTKKKLEKIRSELEEKMAAALKEQQAFSERTIQAYQDEYEKRHEEYARDILTRITEV